MGSQTKCADEILIKLYHLVLARGQASLVLGAVVAAHNNAEGAS
jgi:hypothetical protein